MHFHPTDLAKVAVAAGRRTSTIRHEVAVAARREAVAEALEVDVPGGQVEHLHLRLREVREVDARHRAEGSAVVARHKVTVATRRTAA